jgi:glycerol-3-phosphate acyltransferase PlsY
MGASLGLAWPIGLAYAVTWLGLLAITRISSLAGLTAAIVAPIAAWWLGHSDYAAVLAAIAVLVLFLHRGNIQRLLAGTEPRVGSKG